MKRKLLYGALTGALVLTFSSCIAASPYDPYGYGGPGQYGSPPGYSYQPQPGRQLTTAPPVAETRQIPGRVEFHSTIPIQPGAGALVPRTFSRKGPPQDESLRCFQVSSLYMRMRVKGGYEEGFYTGPAWFCDAGRTGSYRRWVVVYVDRCANDAEGAEAREYPERTETTIREREREVVTEPYPVPQPYPVYEPYPVYAPSVGIGWGWGCGTGYRSTYRSNININRSVNINRTVAPPPRPRFCRPPQRPAQRYCPPGRPARR